MESKADYLAFLGSERGELLSPKKQESPQPALLYYFKPMSHENLPRIQVFKEDQALNYSEIHSMNVARLVAYNVLLFGRPLVIARYIEGYRATWSPGCTELGRTYRLEEGALELLKDSYDAALARGGFECKGGVSGFSRSSGDAATHFLHEQSLRH